MSIKNKILSCFMLSLFVLVSCNKIDDFSGEQSQDTQTYQKGGVKGNTGKICGKTILKFNTLTQIQKAHKELYYEYQTSGENEDVLITFEETRSHYSLRKKEVDMDEGLIPEEPDFDAYDYTSDEIMESILNQDGMVIIGDYLYLWTDGCVIYRIKPANCTNYKALLQFAQLGKQGIKDSELFYYLNDVGVELVNICDDPRYDFESISETGVNIDNNMPPPSTPDSGLDCGYESILIHDILDHDGENKIITIKFDAESIAPIGSSPIYNTHIDNYEDFDSVTILDNSLGLTEGTLWPSVGYVGAWFIVEIDYSSVETPILNVDLNGYVDIFSENSCHDTDSLLLDLECPVSLTSIPVDPATGVWDFRVEGLEDIDTPYSIQWTFAGGDTVIIDDLNSVSHVFDVDCLISSKGVSAFVMSPGICKSQLSTSVNVGDLCKRRIIKKKRKIKHEGRNARMLMEVRRRLPFFGGTSVVKNRLKYRKNGKKSIGSTGNLSKVEGLTCTLTPIASLLPPETQPEDTKKRLKQKLSDGNIYLVDLNIPYSVNFSHTNGFNHTLSYSVPCSE